MLGKISWYRIKKGLIYLQHYGVREFWIRVKERLQTDDLAYEAWYQNHKPDAEELKRQRETRFSHQPVISIVVPVYHTPLSYLEQMITSVQNQTYANYELCIANASPDNPEVRKYLEEISASDARIKVVEVPENLGIAQNTNAAIAIAAGTYIGFLDHDDLLTEDALYEVVQVLQKNEKADLIYSDEDKVTEDLSKYFQPHFKPEFNLDLLRSNNYICHFCVIKKSLIDQVGGLRGEYNGAQDYDLIFRCAEKAEAIVRIPRILYHWRVHRASTSDNPTSKRYAFEAGKRAIEEHLKRCKEEAEVLERKDLGFYRVKYPVKGRPLVSIIIANKDHVGELETCLKSIAESSYQNYEVIIVENNSEEKETFAYYKKIQSEKVRIVYWKDGFNYSAINNYGAKHAKGEYLLLLNNDVKAIHADWMEELLSNCQRERVGIVGAKLYYADGKIQHAGTVIGIGGVAGNLFVGMDGAYSGYMHKASIQQNLSAVTAACFMVKKSVFEEVNGLEEALAVAFNDVDFCLKVRQKGYLVVYNPEAQLYHYESRSRGYEDTKEKLERFQREIDYMKKKWADVLEQGDPMYNPNLSLKACDYTLKNIKRNKR